MLAEAEKSPWQETFAMWSLLLDGGTVGREKRGNSLFPTKCWQVKYTSLRVIAHPYPSVLGDSSTGPAAPGNAPHLPVRGAKV